MNDAVLVGYLQGLGKLSEDPQGFLGRIKQKRSRST